MFVSKDSPISSPAFTRFLFLALTGLVAATIPASASAQSNDTLSKEEISVSVVDVKNSEMPKVVVKGVVDAPPAKVWEIESDCTKYKQRMTRIKAAKLVKKTGDTYICDVTVELPFPLSNLRATTTAKHVSGPPTWSRTWTLLEGDYELNDGSWVLQEFAGDPNRTFVVYSVHAIPNTAVPDWLRKRAQESSMPDVIKRLRTEVKKLK